MTADEARALLEQTLIDWTDTSIKKLLEVSPLTGQDEKLFFFDAKYQDAEDGEEWLVPYAVNKTTSEILNYTVDS